MSPFDDRFAAGMREQLELRRARLAEGDEPIGWKVGFNAPAARTNLGTDLPLVGFLTDRGLLEDGATVALGGWAKPVLEAEIAVHLGRDVPGDASWEDVRAAIAGLGPAIELADLDPPPTDVRAVLAGNIFHRHVVLGPVDGSRSTGEGIGGRVLRDGEEIASTHDPAALTGEIVEVVRSTAEQLAACGELLRAGDVVISGSVVPPQPIAPGQRIAVELGPLGGLSLTFTE
jgi:2-keto-4-pentenoate hydratase